MSLRAPQSPRGALCAAIVLSILLAGCAKKGEDLAPEEASTGILLGTVTDAALTPLVGVNVTVADTGNASMLTDGAGAFRFVLTPGEHLVVAQLAGYFNGAGRADVLTAKSVTLNLTLAPVPKQTPRVESLEGKGLVGCSLALRNGNTVQDTACPEQDANARPTLDFDVTDQRGLEGAVVELDWTSGSKASDTMRLSVSIVTGETEEPMGHTEGKAPISITLPGRLLTPKLSEGSQIRVTAAPTGSLTDEEAALDGGAALQQEFTAYVSYFYYAPPAAGYSVIQG